MLTNRSSSIIFCFVLCCTVLATYWQVSTHSFINFDDNLYIYENSNIQEGLSIRGSLWALTSSHASNWHPVTWLSHMLDVQLFGLDPGRHHIINVLFHLLNAVLLFLFLNGTTKKIWPSCFSCLLFALHPLHVESVAWAAERKDVLSTFFMMLILLSYARYTSRPNLKLYCLVFFFFVLGLMSKPMLVTLPFLLLLLDYWPLNRLDLFLSGSEKGPRASKVIPRNLPHLVYEKAPLFLAAGVSCLITFLVQQQSGAVKSLTMMPFHLRVSNAIVSYVAYLWKLFLPVNLSILYPYPVSIPLWKILGCLILLIAITFAVVKKIKKHPFLTVGWLWYLVSMLPVIGIVQVGVQSLADRYTYIPMIGIFILLSFGVEAWGKVKLKSGLTLGSMIALCFAFLSWIQIGYWKDSQTIFRRAIAVTSDNYTAHNYLAKALAAENKLSEAELHYQEALRIRPNYPEGLVNLGVLLAEQGKTEQAYAYLIRASQIYPNNPKIENNLGNIYKMRGELDRAAVSYKKALGREPKYREALFNLANTLEKQNLFSESIHYYQQAVEVDPAFAKAYNGMGVALARNENLEGAIIAFEKALQIKPNYPNAQKNLALAKRKARAQPVPPKHQK